MRQFQKTFDAFVGCMKLAKEGKTFIYYHPDFVAIDMKSWKKIDKILHVPKYVIYDESGEWTEEQSKMLDKILDERLKKK